MKYIATLFILFIGEIVFAQAGMWTWMKGSIAANSLPVYGTRGVEAPANTPGGVYEAAEWTDLQGNFWLFGGAGNSFALDNTLWKYNPITNNWTWVKGPGIPNDTGSYGMRGVPSLSNNPPARSYGAATWTDLNGDLWLYGGYGVGGFSYSDLWRFNIASNMWTWVQGAAAMATQPLYGTQGVSSPLNTPGEHGEGSATWVDANNNLWMFGGSPPFTGDKNALWRYSISANEWTWMKGGNYYGQSGVYGTQGIPASTNTPGARGVFCSWSDNSGNFWFFGGQIWSGNQCYNDVWRYEPSTNNWTWMSGTNTTNNAGNSGPLCSPSVNYVPSARFETRARWKDRCGNLYLYGSWGPSSSGYPYYSDLWTFDPATLKWALINGDGTPNLVPFYGTQGVASAANTPGGRSGCVGWTSNNGDLYLFGGTVGSYLSPHNDVWKFARDTTCPAVNCSVNCNLLPPAITVNQTVFCEYDSAQICAPSGFASYHWNTGAASACITSHLTGNYYVTVTDNTGCTAVSNNISLTVNPKPVITVTTLTPVICAGDSTQICASGSFTTYHWSNGKTTNCITANLAGNYYLTVTDNTGCTAESNHLAITVYPLPPVSISINGDTLSVHNAVTRQWYLNGSAISGAIDSVYVATVGGSYTVQVADTNGCVATSLPVIISEVQNVPADDVLSVSRLTSGNWQLTAGNNFIGSTAEIFDANGQVVFQQPITNHQSLITFEAPRGVYLLRISSSKCSVVRKLIRL